MTESDDEATFVPDFVFHEVGTKYQAECVAPYCTRPEVKRWKSKPIAGPEPLGRAMRAHMDKWHFAPFERAMRGVA